MNPLHSQQRQPSPAGNLYGYAGQQDDFSTPFNDSNSFAESATLFNQNFNPNYQHDFQASGDNVSDQNFQNALGGHGQYAQFMPPQTDSAAWQNNPYLDTNPYSFTNTVGQPSNFTNNTYSQQRANSYGQDVNMDFSFSNREFGASQPGQPAQTISPAMVDQSEQNMPSSNLQTSNEIWQDSRIGNTGPEPKPTASRPQSVTPISQQSSAFTRPGPIVPLTTPGRPSYNHDELQSGIPEGSAQDGFNIRDQSDFRGSAESQALKGWIYLTKVTFETSESRLASLPDAPVRSSISQLRVKLRNSEAAKLHPAAKAKLEDKLRKRERREKGKKKKKKEEKPAVSKAVSLASRSAVTAVAGQRQSMDASESEDYSDSTASETGSDFDGESDQEDEPSPLPASKPKDPVEAIKYEVLEAVWAPSSKRLASDALKARFNAWLEHIKQARKDWKMATGSAAKLEKKKLLEDLIRLTSKHGHSNFVESIDQLQPLSLLVAASLTELIKAECYEDPLIEAFNLLFLKISVIKWSFVSTAKLDKVFRRVVKNAKGSLKATAELLMDKISRSEKASKETVKKPAEGNTGAVKIEGASDIGLDLTASTDKERMPLDNKRSLMPAHSVKKVTGTDAKKVINVPDDKKLPVSSVQRKPSTVTLGRATLGSLGKSQPMVRTASSESVSNKTSTPSSSGAASKEKERTRYVVTKPPSIFSSISASKKSSTAAAATAVTSSSPSPATIASALATAAKIAGKDTKPAIKTEPKPQPKPTPVASAPRAPLAPLFSFSETLASIGKPKTEEKVKKESVDKRPPETEDEKKKRLRKEARRHLRVSWPTDDKLCHIKLFDHGLEDEIAHEAAEVADLKDEGHAFKREYRQQHNKLDDFEQDFIKESDDVLDPEATDFSVIGDAQVETNLTSRANGKKDIDSPEAAEQKKREQGVMIAVYTSIRDIPQSAKEPPSDVWSPPNNQYDFGDPPLWIRNRSAAEMERMGAGAAQKEQTSVTDLLKNLSQFSQPQVSQLQSQPQTFGGIDPSVQSILAQFSNSQPQPAPAQTSSYDPQAAINLFMSMQGNQAAAPAAVMPSQPPAPAQTTPSGTDLSSILSSLAAMNQPAPQQAHSQPAPSAPQQQNTSPDAAPGVDADILAFLNQYNAGGSQNSQPQAQQSQQTQQTNEQQTPFNLLSLLGQQQQQQGDNNGSAFGNQWDQQQPNGNDRKRGHDDDGNNGGGRKKKAYYGEPKVLCKYWKQGKCHYGDKCTFKHD